MPAGASGQAVFGLRAASLRPVGHDDTDVARQPRRVASNDDAHERKAPADPVEPDEQTRPARRAVAATVSLG